VPSGVSRVGRPGEHRFGVGATAGGRLNQCQQRRRTRVSALIDSLAETALGGGVVAFLIGFETFYQAVALSGKACRESQGRI
jgi:hypothetical protein